MDRTASISTLPHRLFHPLVDFAQITPIAPQHQQFNSFFHSAKVGRPIMDVGYE